MNTSFRPIPQFAKNETVFVSKRSLRSTPKKIPPRPPSKSSIPFTRFSSQRTASKAQAVSFKDNSDSSLSKHYDESRQESYFDQCFQVFEKIGSGSFGDVFRVRSKEDGMFYAVKKSRERFKGKSDRQRKLEEVAKHEQLPKHLNLVRFYKAWEEKQYLYIQTELCKTSLTDFLEVNHEVDERLVWNYLIDLLFAVKHLHDHNLIHLDIKPDNIFISTDGICKLGDFGLVIDLSKTDINEATEGDPKYLAKELMHSTFTKAADIFSLGITILELACDLELPSGGQGWHLLRSGQIPSEFFNNLSPELKQVIQDMMHPDYRLRPTAQQLLNYPVIKNDLTTPPHYNCIKRISSSDWDNSFSDDDVFETSFTSDGFSTSSDDKSTISSINN
ncbi:membrane-associated tyrosine- and threonine-specific cdc2-inhibitory kinase-like protein [Dinothrombium tinctorium]|uniref:Membrane-associated tyrosine- and threonine-specific cdc2-inhibitory kinase n=1 Tax=Dinothrombium tinctorium TaxID=1965070 RepID=A0A443QYH0_9ACAR|nr:membrane-associated tyrosine- and threonine-specific cdc2-inhibitory kinase-like protein [Dinothrombium tinctorium]